MEIFARYPAGERTPERCLFTGHFLGTEINARSSGSTEVSTKASLSYETVRTFTESWDSGADQGAAMPRPSEGVSLSLDEFLCRAAGRWLACYSPEKKICVLLRMEHNVRPDSIVAAPVSRDILPLCKGFANYIES